MGPPCRAWQAMPTTHHTPSAQAQCATHRQYYYQQLTYIPLLSVSQLAATRPARRCAPGHGVPASALGGPTGLAGPGLRSRPSDNTFCKRLPASNGEAGAEEPQVCGGASVPAPMSIVSMRRPMHPCTQLAAWPPPRPPPAVGYNPCSLVTAPDSSLLRLPRASPARR